MNRSPILESSSAAMAPPNAGKNVKDMERIKMTSPSERSVQKE